MDKKTLYMIGNSHIDPVWLWMKSEGMQEVKASFCSALERINEFPDFIFTHTSLSFLAWIKSINPTLFSEISSQIRNNRWEVAGGMWVEPDCNIPAAESLIRHFLYSQHFMKEHFERFATVGFNPDSFGHSANLPTILKGCGLEAYVTSRPDALSSNIPPVFAWEAPSGAKVKAERTGGEYMAWTKASIKENIDISLQLMSKYETNDMAVFYGVGNHGGGPTIDNIRSIYELIDESQDYLIRFSRLDDFFSHVKIDDLEVFKGELGRIFMGCYSSDALVKQKNRKAEWALIKAEQVASMALAIGIKHYKYPNQLLDEAWKTVLFNQFHDILAGTSMERARNHAVDEFSFSITRSRDIIMQGVQAIINHIDTRGEGFPLILINPTGHRFKGLIDTEIYMPRARKKLVRLRDADGQELAYCESNYRVSSIDNRKGLLFETELSPYSYKVIRVMEDGPDKYHKAMISVKELKIENEHYSIQFDLSTGCPKSIIIGRKELLGAPMSIKVFDDYRGAWGVKHLLSSHGDIFHAKSIEVIEETPLRVIVRSILEYNKSELCIDYLIGKYSETIKMKLTLHNSERHKLICVSVPFYYMDLKVWNESQFYVEKKIENTNTEYYQHRFAYLEGVNGLGLAIFNSSNYAMIQNQNEYKLILSRSVIFSQGNDENEKLNKDFSFRYMDQGCMDVELQLLPLSKKPMANELIQLADLMHMPIEIIQDSNHNGEVWLRQNQIFEIITENVIVSTLKKALKTDALILRVFETEGEKGRIHFKYRNYSVDLSFTEFEVKTIKLDKDEWSIVNMIEF